MAENIYIPTDSDSQQYSWMSSIEERLDTLESEARLFRASVKGGAIVVYDDDDNQVGRLGEGNYSPASGIKKEGLFFAVSANETRFHFLIDTEEGWVRPSVCYNFVPDTFIPITDSSFVNVYKSGVNILGLGVYTRLVVGADSGTVGEVRLRIGGNFSAAHTIPAGTAKGYEFKWDLTNIIGLLDTELVRIQARRVSGAGNINVYAPDRIQFIAKSAVLGLTSNGIPV